MLCKHSKRKIILKRAYEILRIKTKIITYRKDFLSKKKIQRISILTKNLNYAINNPSVTEKEVSNTVDQLEVYLKKVSSYTYPENFWVKNIEIIFIVTIIFLSTRSYFLQPFQIPTSSMFPTYSGITSKIYAFNENSPKFLKRTWRSLIYGANHYQLYSSRKGKINIPLFSSKKKSPLGGYVYYRIVKRSKWINLFKENMRQYTIFIDKKPLHIFVPIDFNLDDIICKTYFPLISSLEEVIIDYGKNNKFYAITNSYFCMQTNSFFENSECLLKFDTFSGDMLVVNRIYYNFFTPKIGHTMVFRTNKIAALNNNNVTYDQYYIKRLAGRSGDKLKIHPPFLYRNEELIRANTILIKNIAKINNYNGYTKKNNIKEKNFIFVSENTYFMLGDNSINSSDSRYWGEVPKDSIIGKAFFIFYPFTKRWGFAR